jgi:hypothetical protein
MNIKKWLTQNGQDFQNLPFNTNQKEMGNGRPFERSLQTQNRLELSPCRTQGRLSVALSFTQFQKLSSQQLLWISLLKKQTRLNSVVLMLIVSLR